MTNKQQDRIAPEATNKSSAKSVQQIFKKTWTREITKKVILFRAELSDEETWTFVAWLAPKKTRPPDFVFRTLLKNRQHAESLMEMSLEDELNARDGFPRPYFDIRFGPAPTE